LLDSLGELLEKAKATGTILAIEGYVNNIVGRLDQIDALFRTFPTPHLALMLDPYNYISRDLLPTADLICEEFLGRYADRFVIAHLKDVAPLGADGTPDDNGGRADLVGTPEFCTGVFPQQGYMRFLRNRRPDLPIILEHLPVAHLPEAMRRFRSLVGLPG
jgi:sugar phosphate isomerase/epimerase